MHRSNSPNTPLNTPPPTSSALPVTRRSIIPIPPSGPYLHLSPPTFTITNIQLHLRDTFAIGDIVVF